MFGHAQPPKPARRLVLAAAAVAVASALATLLFASQSVWSSQPMPDDGVIYQVDLQVGTGSHQYDLPMGVSVTLPISVMVTGPQPLAAASVLIHYDPAILRPIQCVSRPGAPPGYCNANYDPQNGLIRFNLLSESGIMGAAGLFDLTFETTSTAAPSDQSSVTPLIESLADPNSNYMTSRTFGSTITVVSGGTPATTVYVGAPQQSGAFTVAQGQTTTVPIWITDVTHLGSASFSLALNPAVVRPLACHPVSIAGSDASGVCSVYSDHVRANLLSVAGLSGSVLAFDVVVTAADGAQPGASSGLNLAVNTFADTEGKSIDARIHNQSIQVVATNSPDASSLRIEPASQNLTGDSRAIVHVFLDRAAALSAATWSIRYDPAVLLAESCHLSPDFNNGVCNANGEPGAVRMSLLSADPHAASVEVASITFRRHPEALAAQQSALTFEVTNFADLTGRQLPYQSQSATITLRDDLNALPGVVLWLAGAPPGGFQLARGASLDLPIAFDIDPARPVGSLTGRLYYDPAVLRPTQCLYNNAGGGSTSPMGYCNADYDWAAGIIRFNLLSADGVSGPLMPFTLTVEAASGAIEGQFSDLDLSVEAASDPVGESVTWRAEDTIVHLKPPVYAARVLIGPPGTEDNNGNYTVTLGYTRTVAVWVEGATSLGAATLSLDYDPTIVRATECRIRGDLLPQIAGGFCAPVPASGTVRTNVVMQQGFNGTGHIYDIVFAQAPNVGGGETTPLTMTVENFVSIAEVPIPTTVRSGQLEVDAGLRLDKTAAESEFAAAGDILHYSYEITNGSLAPIRGLATVADDKVSVSCPDTSTIGNHDAYLDVGERIICTATYTVQEEDVIVRSVTNTATATMDGMTSNQDMVTVYKPYPTSVTLRHFSARRIFSLSLSRSVWDRR